MARDEKLKEQWEEVVTLISNKFADGDTLDLDAIIYIIGLQELGKLNTNYKKDEKINLMHIAICRLLEPFGYYAFDYFAPWANNFTYFFFRNFYQLNFGCIF